jgi:addiction module HigA family antidote
MAFKNGMRPVHPGEVLREDYLKPLDLSVNALSKRLGIPTSRLNDIVLERRGVSSDTAMRLARYFGGDARSWLNLQTAHDLRIAEISKAKEIERTVEPMRKSAFRILPPNTATGSPPPRSRLQFSIMRENLRLSLAAGAIRAR